MINITKCKRKCFTKDYIPYKILEIIILSFVLSSVIFSGCNKNETQSSSSNASRSSEISEPQNSGIEGIAMIGPLHPVEQTSQKNEAPYPDAVIIIRNKTSGDEIKRSSVDSNGYFKIPLSPGYYILDAKNKTGSGLPISKPIDVAVLLNEYTNITVRFDSGIR